jgi:hypothetical protein
MQHQAGFRQAGMEALTALRFGNRFAEAVRTAPQEAGQHRQGGLGGMQLARRRLIAHPGHFANKRIALKVIQRAQRFEFASNEMRRSFVSHYDTLEKTTKARRNGRAFVQQL